MENYFNSPSRYAIYRNILYLSEMFSTYAVIYPDPWEEFLKYDVINDGLPI